VRAGVATINLASLAPILRSLSDGALGKLALIGAGASVALIPIVARELAPALADGKASPEVRSAIIARTFPRAHASTRIAKGATRASATRARVAAARHRAAKTAFAAPEPRQAPAEAPSSGAAPSQPSATDVVPTPSSSATIGTVPVAATAPQAKEPPVSVPPVQLPSLTVPPQPSQGVGVLDDALTGVRATLP
jgi:hypothetical protein